ncbi:MAG: hypothetical protein GTN76_14940 [Candidatus Aenigmarchaeota archaeon]|nr:hypothetical protein [Candidatus Aenigmarchaeota archaeon]
MGETVCIYLTIGRPGRESTICRLDNAPETLIHEVAKRAYEQLLKEAQQLRGEDSEVGKVKRKSAWLLKTTLEELLPGINFEK